jgi:Uma2 family endonuclease
MATQPVSDRFVPVEEYLSTSYEPDREYDDGVVVERNLGEIEHSLLQTLLGTLFTNQMDAWGVFGLTEQRIQLSPGRFVVPDVCVVPVGAPWQKILTDPPLVAIEILSPEDTLRRAEVKAREYLQFGVEHVWVIDPYARVAYRAATRGLELQANGELSVPATPIVVRLADLFEKLDRVRAQAREK